MKIAIRVLIALALTLTAVFPATAAQFKKLDKPPLSERWFGIYVDNERVGFYRQAISEAPDGYRIEGDGSVRMKVMGFSKESSMRETYLVGKGLALRSFEVEQAINGSASRISGKVGGNIIRITSVANGKKTEKQLKYKGEVYPGPALNLYPLMRDLSPGKSYTTLTFDPEELKVKEVKISVLGQENTPSSQPAIKLRNNLYPFVNNDIWVDDQGNTLLESVRDGLVITRAEEPTQLGSFVGGVALAKKDLIYDFSLVRAEPPIKDSKKLTGLSVEISGWNDNLPLRRDGGQTVEKSGEGRIAIKTGRAVPETALQDKAATARESDLKPADKIESDAPEITAKAKELAAGRKEPQEVAKALASWTSDWLRDTVEDGGGALASFKSRSGNCQTHARLYTALARAAGIPTRFVSGLVYLDGKGFLYHSWAESLLNGRWVAIDPTYDQMPADPTHLKLLEGHLPEDMAPIVTIIGRIHVKVLEAKY
ncbi:transglutaminase domain-containing protein [Geobacter sp. FeAm09]|uniref:transglutaminase-like domain-containing protein n=1 Tax=Geobacter sp. FeAm09 TaxID=2597769 RepID=UPI0011EFBC0C|nr:transglutaminase-like domain-containing protein [Geobacter sp. FeAm09]QEM66938.1 transglutaminase domain-containing protein [Geobacter sp. FeAm09]